MKYFLLWAILLIDLYCCYGQSKYKFLLQSPEFSVADPLTYNDEKIKIDFYIDRSAINFIVTNKTKVPIKLIWDEASIVIDGKAEKVTHKGIKNLDKGASQPASVIPPKSALSDLAIPSENVYWSSTFKDWNYRPLLPDHNGRDLEQNKGKTISMFLPLKINSKMCITPLNLKYMA
ncbi:hypothetical protein GCM10023189_05950 [Nibrella saemangeumensis]|uniref:Uncharacterized protein n=1 Tax=Nibrella saemangeumensis TaxID=1084526 RepID=A0ABP8MFF3_9BACT